MSLPPEMMAQAQALGVDTGSIFGTPMADRNDLPVYAGKRQKEVTSALDVGPRYVEEPETKLSSEMEKHFYSLDEDALADLQTRLWAGGFYSQGVDPKEIVRGDYDEQSFAAWKRAVDRAANFYSAKKQLTIDEVIDMASGTWDETGARRGTGGREPLTVKLTNPDDLRKVAQRAAVSALGRGFRPDELEKFVSSFQATQAQTQRAGYGMEETGGTVTNVASPDAAAEAYARRTAPTEAGAHDFVNVYDAFTKILARRG